MSDLISRRAAIAVADGTDYTGLDVADVIKVTDEVVKGLKQLPSAEPQWIPCEERLPEEDGRYLVTICDSGIKEFPLIRMYSYAKNLKAVDKYDFPKKINGWFGYDGEFGYYEVPDVVAWMPLPKPYEGRTE